MTIQHPYCVEIILTSARNGGMSRCGIQFQKITLEKLTNDIGMALDHSPYGVNPPAHYDLIETQETNEYMRVIFGVSEDLYKSIKSHGVDLRMHNAEIYCQRSNTIRFDEWDEM